MPGAWIRKGPRECVGSGRATLVGELEGNMQIFGSGDLYGHRARVESFLVFWLFRSRNIGYFLILLTAPSSTDSPLLALSLKSVTIEARSGRRTGPQLPVECRIHPPPSRPSLLLQYTSPRSRSGHASVPSCAPCRPHYPHSPIQYG